MNMRVRWLHYQAPLLLLAALCLLAAATSPLLAQNYRIEVRAEPSRLTYQADSPNNNRVLIWVKVRDAATSAPAPDMVPVRFATSLGVISPLVYTRNGEATATLENIQGPGRAKVDVQMETGAFSTLYIEYLGSGGIPVQTVVKPRVRYHLTARQCYYSTDKSIFDLRDSAKFTSPELTVTASAIQFDARLSVLTAQFGVVVKKGEISFTAHRVRLDFAQSVGIVEIVEPEIGKRIVDLSTLQLQDDPRAQTMVCEPLNLLPTRTWIVCPDATVYPNEQQAHFRRPKFYVNNVDLPILWMPYHVLNYGQSQNNTLFNFQATVTSDPGLNIDFPIFYAASASHIGSLHLRHLTKNSSPTGTAGLQIGIEEEYRLGNYADGALYLDDLTRDTRSAIWEHSHDFGKMHLSTSASYDRYSATDAYTTRGSISLSRPLGQVSTSLSGSYSEYKGQRSYDTTLYLSPPGLSLGKTGFSLGFNPFFGWQSTTSSDSSARNGFSQGLNCSLGVPIVRVLGGSLLTSVNDGISRYTDGTIVNNFDVSIRFQRTFLKKFVGSVGYSFNQQHSSNSTTADSTPSQRLDLNFSGNGDAWEFYSYASYALDSESLFGSLNTTYYLPWDLSKRGQRRWFLQYASTMSMMSASLGTQRSIEHVFTLGRPIGTYTVQLHYSPTDSTGVMGIGMVTGKKWALELVRNGW